MRTAIKPQHKSWLAVLFFLQRKTTSDISVRLIFCSIFAMERFALGISFSLLVLQQVTLQVAGVSKLTGFYPHGIFEGDNTLQRSTGPGPSYQTVQLMQTARFYGGQYSAITVRN